jgi:hypothetical protein
MDKLKLTSVKNMKLSNRDGDLLIGKSADDKCYLILETQSYKAVKTFSGLGPTEHIEITNHAFEVLHAI